MLFVQVGNHEFVGTKLTRYLDSTWEGLGGKRGGTPPPEEDSSGPHPQGKPWAPLPMEGSSAVEEEWGGDEGLQIDDKAVPVNDISGALFKDAARTQDLAQIG